MSIWQNTTTYISLIRTLLVHHFQWRWAMAIDQTMIQKGSWGMDQQGTAIGNVMKEKGSWGIGWDEDLHPSQIGCNAQRGC